MISYSVQRKRYGTMRGAEQIVLLPQLQRIFGLVLGK